MRRRPLSLRKKIGIALAVPAVAYAAAVVAFAWFLVRPPRPRISGSDRPTVGLVLEESELGVRVAAAAPPASDIGLAAGDRLVRSGDTPVYTPSDVDPIVAALAPGDRLRIEARRTDRLGDESAILVDVPVEVRPLSPADHGLPYVDVALTDERGMTLRGWYIAAPRTPAGGSPAVVYGHDHRADRRQWLPVAATVHRAGAAQLFLDFAGRGDSEGSTVTLGIDEAADLEAGLDFLSGTPGIDPDRIALAGRGMGAVAAILAAYHDPRVHRLVLDSPYTDLARVVDENLAAHRCPPVLFRGPLLAVAAIWARFDPYEIRPIDVVPSLDLPILLFHGVGDTVIDPSHAWAFQKASPGTVRLVQLASLGHDDPRPAEYARTVAADVTE